MVTSRDWVYIDFAQHYSDEDTFCEEFFHFRPQHMLARNCVVVFDGISDGYLQGSLHRLGLHKCCLTFLI